MSTVGTPSLPTLQQIKVRSCNLCRHRRVKCDRQFPCCSNCLRAESNCVYPPGRGRAPKVSRDSLNPQLSHRLSRLESIIRQFGAVAQDPREASGSPSFDRHFSRLKIDDSRSYYVSNVLWVTLANEVEELRDLLFEPAAEDADCELPPSPYPSYAPSTTSSSSSHSGLNGAIFGYRAVASSLQPFHPSLPQAVTLFAAFTKNVAPIVRIFHMPTLTRICWDAIASIDSLDKNTETLLFAIHYSAIISITPEQCLRILGETREVALERYRFAVEQALARANLLNTQSMTMLQAAVLFLSALPNEDDSRTAWSLTSLIYHISRTMGIHRDGTVFGLKPFETELRRRLWWQICIIDSRSSEYHCNEPIVRELASDTKPPLHINDDDLLPEMTEPPAERWDEATDMTLSLIRCEAIQTGWKLGLTRPGQHRGTGREAATADENKDPHKHHQDVVRNLEERLRDKFLRICNPSVPFHLISSAVARLIIARFWLVVHYPLASRPKEGSNDNKDNQAAKTPTSSNGARGPDQLDSSMRDKLFQTSIEILELSGLLLTNKDIVQWTWYSKTHIQWGAMAFVLSELCTRPHSSECDRAWDCVTAVYDGWKMRENKENENKLALWRPIRRLMAKARYVREMQQIDPSRPAQDWYTPHQHEAGQHLDLPTFATEFLSNYSPSTQDDPASVPLPFMPSPIGTSGPSSSFIASPALGIEDPEDTIQSVFGTETLDPFMDLLPDWYWGDAESGSGTSLGANFGFPPGST